LIILFARALYAVAKPKEGGDEKHNNSLALKFFPVDELVYVLAPCFAHLKFGT
jgi:hypothetical protein